MIDPVTELPGTAPAVSHAVRGTGAMAPPDLTRLCRWRSSRSLRAPPLDEVQEHPSSTSAQFAARGLPCPIIDHQNKVAYAKKLKHETSCRTAGGHATAYHKNPCTL